MSVFKNLNVKELYASIPSATTISQLMRVGLEQGSTQLAVSAMEELLLRKDQEKVHENLIQAISNGDLKPGTSMSALIARSLLESHDASGCSKVVGRGLLKESLAEMETTMADSYDACYGRIPRSGEAIAAKKVVERYRDASAKWLSGPITT